MTRRRLLQASTASVILPAITRGASASSQTLVVADGLDRWGHRITARGFPWVKVSSKDTGGAWTMFESPVSPQFGVPLHIHHHMEEWFFILEGEFLFEVDGGRHPITAGTSVLIPRGSPHRFKNTGTVTGRFIGLCQPAGLMEECVAALSRMTEADRSNAEKMKAVFAEYDVDVIGPALP
jgi:mannose-6-phosphate isomerase-like protein (cupin superfamily)